jgi:type VI secretion system protein ImpJ
MRQLQPVLWTRGVLLAPQHLQMQDRFLEDSMQFRLAALTHARWGFQRLEIAEAALASGQVRITAASGIFPDGLLFDFPAADAAPPPKSIGAWPADEPAVPIHLGIPEYRNDGWNVATDRTTAAARYISDMVLKRDENTGLAEKPIEIARKNFRVMVGPEALDGYSTLPVARVIREPAGAIRLDPHFIPPVLDVACSPYLTALMSKLFERMAARSAELSQLRRQRNESLADFSLTGIASFWLLHTVNSHLPVIKHLLDSKHAHPARLFEAMLALAGSLTTFSRDLLPQSLPVYNHADLGGCFVALEKNVFDLLDTVLPTTAVSLALRRDEDRNVFSTVLENDAYLKGNFYLAVQADMDRAALLGRAPELKVGSVEDVEQMVRRSLPGLSLVHTPVAPNGLPVKLDYQYFRIGQEGDAWNAIQRSRSVAVYAPAAFRDPRFELVIMLPLQ